MSRVCRSVRGAEMQVVSKSVREIEGKPACYNPDH